MSIKKPLVRIIVYIVSLILLDQLIKWWMVHYHPFLVSENKGILFGLIKNTLIVYLSLFFGIIILILLIVKNKLATNDYRLSTILIFSGVLSNIIDRVWHRFVIDYINLGFWPTFNLADIFILSGVVLYLITFLKTKNHL